MKPKKAICLTTFLSALALSVAAWRWTVLPGDVIISQIIQGINFPIFELLMRAVSENGLRMALLVIAFTVLSVFRRWLEMIFVAGGTGLSHLLTFIIKEIVHRPRPMPDLVNVYEAYAGFSFPSGHVMGAVALYGFLLYLTWKMMKPSWWQRAIMVLLAALIILVGGSRIYLGAHWFSDVIGAYFIGSLFLAMVIHLYSRVRQHQEPKIKLC